MCLTCFKFMLLIKYKMMLFCKVASCLTSGLDDGWGSVT
jgi:hypothetical protein